VSDVRRRVTQPEGELQPGECPECAKSRVVVCWESDPKPPERDVCPVCGREREWQVVSIGGIESEDI